MSLVTPHTVHYSYVHIVIKLLVICHDQYPVHIVNSCVVYPVIVCTCSDSTGQPSSPATTVSVWLAAIVIILMVVVISIGVIMAVTVVCLLRWKRNHGGQGIAAGEGT